VIGWAARGEDGGEVEQRNLITGVMKRLDYGCYEKIGCGVRNFTNAAGLLFNAGLL